MSIQTIKNKVIDKVSDVMSYPARRNAQKSMIDSDKKLAEIKKNRETMMPKTMPKTPQVMQKQALKMMAKPLPQMSQRDTYNKAMMGATRNGGSNGVGVGY